MDIVGKYFKANTNQDFYDVFKVKEVKAEELGHMIVYEDGYLYNFGTISKFTGNSHIFEIDFFKRCYTEITKEEYEEMYRNDRVRAWHNLKFKYNFRPMQVTNDDGLYVFNTNHVYVDSLESDTLHVKGHGFHVPNDGDVEPFSNKEFFIKFDQVQVMKPEQYTELYNHYHPANF